MTAEQKQQLQGYLDSGCRIIAISYAYYGNRTLVVTSQTPPYDTEYVDIFDTTGDRIETISRALKI